ncbi:MAG TPA: DUF697 domain-containing protein [Humidesulfovibrio sp.]|uniref:YcjF family protein n=1 Tax=Humidesulfovibrio sp. TaxID=2910988 RepID=UPI002CC52522|nr:DUF697 domain-containing protein [Humidesulfovibrio sp.]HWR03457.1 DUF697 domain-containing protein [Humidesulfovibrio sp.]
MNANEELVPTAQTAESVHPEQEIPVVAQCEIDALIRKRVYGAMALGLAPVAVLDLVGLFAIQVELVNALAKKYDVPFSKDKAKNIIGSLLGSALPVALGPAAFSLLKLIPLIGMTAGAATMTIMGGASTYAVGRVFNRHFASGGTLLDMDAGKLKESFRTYYNDGKQYVKGLRKKSPEAQGATEDAATAQSAS